MSAMSAGRAQMKKPGEKPSYFGSQWTQNTSHQALSFWRWPYLMKSLLG
jgi:hypothetical protein